MKKEIIKKYSIGLTESEIKCLNKEAKKEKLSNGRYLMKCKACYQSNK